MTLDFQITVNPEPCASRSSAWNSSGDALFVFGVGIRHMLVAGHLQAIRFMVQGLKAKSLRFKVCFRGSRV